MKRFISILFIYSFLFSTIYGDQNNLDVYQNGDSNVLEIIDKGLNNDVNIVQEGNSHVGQILMEEDSTNALLKLTQKMYENEAIVFMNGKKEKTDLSQSGEKNTITIEQQTSEGEIYVTQGESHYINSSKSTITQYGENNIINHVQDGIQTDGIINQYGVQNTVTLNQLNLLGTGQINQTGERNTVNVTQDGVASRSEVNQLGIESEATIKQIGDNSATINQGQQTQSWFDNSNNKANIEQKYTWDYAVINQDGKSQTANIYQLSPEQHATINQTGVQSFITITQSGGFSRLACDAYVDQRAEDSTIDIIQDGSSNATVDQGGVDNLLTITQNSTLPSKANVIQGDTYEDVGNVITIEQTGSYNISTTKQIGSYNTITIAQD